MKRTALYLVLSLVFLEWLDFSLYLYLAKAVFANDFFPASTYSLMLSFALFGAAYIARPMGGWLFGRQADLTGRRQPMVFSAALMGFATLGICVLPDFNDIGLFATWGLLLMRILQGIALGGEVNTSAMFLVEHHPRRPLVAGSLVAASGALGMFIGGALAALVQYAHIPWLWRFIFAIVGTISIAICVKRNQLQESPEFAAKPLATVNNRWRSHSRGIINIAAVGAYVSVTVYLCNVFWVSYSIDKQLWSPIQGYCIGALAQLSSALLAIPIARLCKREWAGYLLKLSMLIALFTAPILFYVTQQHWALLALLCLLGYILANALLCSSMYYFFYLQLPTQYRCRGVSTTYAVAASLGAFSLPVAQYTVTIDHLYWLPGAWVSVVAVTSLILIRATSQKDKSYAI